jgi:cysteine desulfurase
MLYFDHNATTPLSAFARKAWLDASDQFVGNPSSPHRLGSRADAALNSAREKLAGYLACDPASIIWTSGATESNNAVLHHLARSATSTQGIFISAIEHPCVLASAEHYFPKRRQFIPVTKSGVIDLNWLHERFGKTKPAMVAIMAANNETGVLQPWREALQLCREHDVQFFCDAAQWIGKLPAKGLGECDFVSGCAHKFGGPKGVGFLKMPDTGTFQSLLLGGHQEESRRAGTENVASVIAMVAALEEREQSLANGVPEERLRWRKEFETRLLQELPGAEIIGQSVDRLWNTVSALMPEMDCRQRWVVRLDRFGYAVSTGSACASGREAPSHVLAAMGYSPDQASRALRFSSGLETTESDWTRLLEGLLQTRDSFRSSSKP